MHPAVPRQMGHGGRERVIKRERRERERNGLNAQGRHATPHNAGTKRIRSRTMTQPSSQLPLAGVKVVELGQLIAGPFAGKTLADFGAEVVKIEPPGEGDPLRKWRHLHNGTSVWWQVQSRNKQSVVLDLREPRGQEIVRR